MNLPRSDGSRVDLVGENAQRFLSRTDITLLCVFVLLLSARLIDNGADLDLFARMAVGRLIIELGSVPTIDPFSFTEKLPLWIDHEWLAGVLFFKAWTWLGEFGLLAVEIFFVFLTSALLLAGKRSYDTRSSFDLFLLILLNLSLYGLWGGTVRSLIFSYLGVALTATSILLYLKKDALYGISILPLYMVVWANAHAGFVIGLGTIAYFAAAFHVPNIKRAVLLGVLFASILATFINPYGPFTFWSFVVHAVFKTRSSITEWMPVQPVSKEALWAYLWIVPFIIALWKTRRVDPNGIAICAIALFLGFRSYRMMAFFYLFSFIFLSPVITEFFEDTARRFYLHSKSLFRASALFMVALLFSAGSFSASVIYNRGFSLSMTGFPVSSLRWIRENRQSGNLLIHFDWGSYAMWELYPRFRVAIDGRYEEVYPDATVILADDALNAESKNHLEALNKINPDLIVVQDQDFKIEAFQKFKEVFRNGNFIVLEKQASLS